MFFINLFHLYGFNKCYSEACCSHLHTDADGIKGLHYNRNSCSRILVLTLAVLPILGQLIGLLEIIVGIRTLFSSNRQIERMSSYSLLFRGIMTFIGLGIICLLIDIIITVVAYIKTCIKPINKNSVIL